MKATCVVKKTARIANFLERGGRTIRGKKFIGKKILLGVDFSRCMKQSVPFEGPFVGTSEIEEKRYSLHRKGGGTREEVVLF